MDTKATFKESSERYIKFILSTRQVSQKTEISYMRYWSEYFGDKPVSSIERYDVANARDALLNHIQDRLAKSGRNGTGIVAVNRRMARLSHFFSICSDWGLHSETNPCTRIKPFKENKVKVVVLTTAEICLLLSECEASKNKELLLAVLMIVTSGARKSEVLNLTYEQIDYENKNATLKKSKNGDTATIGFNDEVMNMLRNKRRTKGPIFERTYIDKGFKMAVKRAGLPDMSLHGLRHVYASQIAKSGLSLLMVQEALRLKSVKLVQRYAHLVPSVVHNKVLNISNNWKIKPQDKGMTKESFPMQRTEFLKRMQV